MAEQGAREQAQATEGNSPGRDNLRRWIKFAQRLLILCNEILKASNVPLGRGLGKSKVLALAVLCRTYLNLKGVLAVANEGLIVEACTLARSCFENLIYVTALNKKQDKFVTEMRDHDLRSQRSLGVAAFRESRSVRGGVRKAASASTPGDTKASSEGRNPQSERDRAPERRKIGLLALQPVVCRRCSSLSHCLAATSGSVRRERRAGSSPSSPLRAAQRLPTRLLLLATPS